MNQQELVWIKLPFSNLEETKIRPAVVVSNNDYSKKNRDVVVCAVTSNLDDNQYSIFIDNTNLSSGNLPIKSRVRADKIIQVEKNLIIKSFAKLDNKTFDELIKKIVKLIQREK